MIINIYVDPKLQTNLDLNLIENAVRFTLENEDKTEVEISIKLSDDIELRQLNETYRNIDKTTDVLAFNQGYNDPETGQTYLGDIIISVEQAQLQADENHQTLDEECARLAIHGTLHLLGYDHAEPADKEEMWDKQEGILEYVRHFHLEDNQ
jgi:probable rRNA maturation factor